MVIRIDELNPTVLPSKDYEVPAMKDGLTVRLTVGQILNLLIDGAPETLDTLNEIAAALNDDANLATTLAEAISEKADKVITIGTSGLATGGGNLTANRTITVPKASTLQAEGREDDEVSLTPLSGDKLGAARDARFLHVRDQKTNGTMGGTSIAGTQVRSLNTIVTNTVSGASLSSNVVTLPSGTYDVLITTPALKVDNHRAWLRVAGGGDVLLDGSTEYSGGANITQTRSTIAGRITLASNTDIEIAHYTNAVFASQGLGASTPSSGRPEVFTEAMFWKVD